MNLVTLFSDQTFLRTSQIVVSVIGVVFILLQNRTESGNNFFGGGGEVYKVRRGFQNVLFYATIVAVMLLLVLIYFDLRV